MAGRHRSPAYPSLSLEKAVLGATQFQRAEGKFAAPVATAIEHIGYSGASSRGFRALASLIHFGLMEDQGSKDNRQAKLTELGLDLSINFELGSPEFNQNLQKAALKPDIHKELWAKWGEEEGRLPSDASMRQYLVKEKGFNPKAVEEFIDQFKRSLAYAGLIEGQATIEIDDTGEESKVIVATSGSLNQARPSNSLTGSKMVDMTIPLFGGGIAILRVQTPMTRSNLEQIKRWLELYENTLEDSKAENVE